MIRRIREGEREGEEERENDEGGREWGRRERIWGEWDQDRRCEHERERERSRRKRRNCKRRLWASEVRARQLLRWTGRRVRFDRVEEVLRTGLEGEPRR